MVKNVRQKGKNSSEEIKNILVEMNREMVCKECLFLILLDTFCSYYLKR